MTLEPKIVVVTIVKIASDTPLNQETINKIFSECADRGISYVETDHGDMIRLDRWRELRHMALNQRQRSE